MYMPFFIILCVLIIVGSLVDIKHRLHKKDTGHKTKKFETEMKKFNKLELPPLGLPPKELPPVVEVPTAFVEPDPIVKPKPVKKTKKVIKSKKSK